MMSYGHGGDILTAEARFGGPVLDFSANLSPLGMPEPVRRAAAEAVADAVRYPDPLCRALRAAIAARDGVEAGQVICGNGAADLIFRLVQARRPKRALVTAPTFSEYEQALESVGCQVERHLLDPGEGFDVTDAILERIVPGVDLVFLCTPNNPTGRPVDRALLGRALRRCGEVGALLAVDECFLELSDQGDGPGLAPWVGETDSLFLLRAFTKSYAIPGLRLGYGLCRDGALLDAMGRVGQPWPVSAPAQAAGLACAALPDWPARARETIRRERAWLLAELRALGLTVWEGTANYLLFRAAGAADLRERLLERGVLIRSCANYAGLDKDYYRVAVRPREENERLIAALKEVL